GVWGATDILVPGATTNNNYFPRYSPDGRYIAYVHATSGSQGATSAELRLIRADGGTSIVLATANRRVGSIDDANLSNTMPAWAPSIDSSTGGDGDLA